VEINTQLAWVHPILKMRTLKFIKVTESGSSRVRVMEPGGGHWPLGAAYI
jgi:hypothetical protein